ncbi:MAG: DUF4097 family beta strand repeat protein [Halanaerobiales bacterium]|nr:DUF4097 family beta strand repeat protein [Halanaerobiales bacterium]
MRKFLVCFVFILVFTMGVLAYEETRLLELVLDNTSTLRVKCEAGDLSIEGVDGLEQIEVIAEIYISKSKDKAEKIIDRDLELSLVKEGKHAVLSCGFDNNNVSSWLSFFFGNSYKGSVDLIIRVPNDILLDITDGSGNIIIKNSKAKVEINDGSGDIEILDCFNDLEIVDGSGDLIIKNIRGNVQIDDGSGDIEIYDINGYVTVKDGSGSIDIDTVEKDVKIIYAGSGGIEFSNIKGQIIQ